MRAAKSPQLDRRGIVGPESTVGRSLNPLGEAFGGSFATAATRVTMVKPATLAPLALTTGTTWTR